MLRNTENRYGSLSIWMHWGMLFLLVAVYACIELREIYPKGSAPREVLKQWHYMLGLAVLGLVVFRLAIRLWGTMPRIVPPEAAWQRMAARLMHLALYLLMIGMPIAGWLILSAEGKPVPFFGMELPPLISKDKDLAHRIEELHETAGTAGYWLVGLHALAALFHHYVVRDNTLLRMLPGRAQAPRAVR